ncbi:MAG: multiheme c-type cytochrome [Pseudomonadota bacterium]
MRCPNSFISLLFFLPVTAGIAVAQENVYVGAERCRSCHVKAYDVWTRSQHARAQASLPESRRGELRCLFCHATDTQANLVDYAWRNVQCEACHGAGNRHIALAVKNAEKVAITGSLEQGNEQKCRNCHGDIRSPNIRPFNYANAVQRIRHW